MNLIEWISNLFCKWFGIKEETIPESEFVQVEELKDYKINHGSGECHFLPSEHKNCKLDEIKNFEYCDEKRFHELMESDSKYNGCRYCNKKYDKG